jgi:hypothetical protein
MPNIEYSGLENIQELPLKIYTKNSAPKKS